MRVEGFHINTSLGLRSTPRLAIFGAAGLFAVWFGFLSHSAADAGLLLQHHGYVAMLATFVWWIWTLVALGRTETSPTFWRAFRTDGLLTHREAIIIITGLSVVAFCSVPYSWKVLYDEMVLQATSFNVHFFHEFGTIARGYEVGGEFRSLDVYVDKRPFFFPFLVSVVHDLTGHRTSNGFLLNTALMPVVLALVYSTGRALGGKWPGLAALAAFGGFSLLAQNANGIGMEMLNLVMFLAVLRLGIFYLEQPCEPRVSALVVTCVLLAQTRYESALFVAPAALIIAEGWRRAGRIILPPAALASPVLLIPCALHNVYLSGTPDLWELNENNTSRFGTVYLADNLRCAGVYFFNLRGPILNSWFLSVTGFAALGWCVWSIIRGARAWRRARPADIATILMGLAVATNLGLLMCYYWGRLDEPIVSRLVLPFSALQALAISWVVGRLPERVGVICGRWLSITALLAYLGFGLWGSAMNETRNQIAEESLWEERWLEKQPPVSRLMISNKSGLSWLAQGRPTLSVGIARHRARQIEFHLRAGTFEEVLVSQYYRPVGPDGGFILDPRNELPSSFVLEPVIERQVGGKLLRISRIIRIDLPVETSANSKPDDVGVMVATQTR